MGLILALGAATAARADDPAPSPSPSPSPTATTTPIPVGEIPRDQLDATLAATTAERDAIDARIRAKMPPGDTRTVEEFLNSLVTSADEPRHASLLADPELDRLVQQRHALTSRIWSIEGRRTAVRVEGEAGGRLPGLGDSDPTRPTVTRGRGNNQYVTSPTGARSLIVDDRALPYVGATTDGRYEVFGTTGGTTFLVDSTTGDRYRSIRPGDSYFVRDGDATMASEGIHLYRGPSGLTTGRWSVMGSGGALTVSPTDIRNNPPAPVASAVNLPPGGAYVSTASGNPLPGATGEVRGPGGAVAYRATTPGGLTYQTTDPAVARSIAAGVLPSDPAVYQRAGVGLVRGDQVLPYAYTPVNSPGMAHFGVPGTATTVFVTPAGAYATSVDAARQQSGAVFPTTPTFVPVNPSVTTVQRRTSDGPIFTSTYNSPIGTSEYRVMLNPGGTATVSNTPTGAASDLAINSPAPRPALPAPAPITYATSGYAGVPSGYAPGHVVYPTVPTYYYPQPSQRPTLLGFRRR